MTSVGMVAPEVGEPVSAADAGSHAEANRSRVSGSLPLESVERGRSSPDSERSLLDQAVDEYYRLIEEGKQPDVETFYTRFPSCWGVLRNIFDFDLTVVDHPAILLARKEDASLWPIVGEKCGDVTLLRPLGSGTFAQVFLAAEESTGGRLVAVKFSQGGAAEARTLGRLSHPHIVPILSARQEEYTGLTMVCMPYLGSATLENLLDRVLSMPDEQRPRKAAIILDVIRACAQPEDPPAKSLDPRLQRGSYTDGVIHLAVQLAETLAFLHANHVCHRDLKPSNVLLDPSGKPLLLDFNLSTSELEKDVPKGGSLAYMAPEQIHAFLNKQEAPIDERADLYAFGVIVYCLLNGEFPGGPIPPDLHGVALARFLWERLKLGFRPLRRVRPDLERPVAAVLERCLAVDPAARPRSAAELVVALKRQFAPARRMRRWLAARPCTVVTAIGLLLFSATAAGFAWSELPPYSERAYQQGETAYRAGDYDEAEKHFALAVRADPNNPRFRIARGCARLKQSKTLPDNQAKDKLDQAWGDLNSTTNELLVPPMLALKAYIHNREQNPEKAIYCYELLGQMAYCPVQVLNNRAYSHIQLKQFKKARIDLDQAARLHPPCQAVFYNRAMLAFYEQMDAPSKSSMPLQTLDDIERAIHLGPTTAILYRDAALLYAQASWDDLRHAPVSLDAPIGTAFHLWMREQRRERALFYLRQATAGGQTPGWITRNYHLQRALKSHPAFADLQQLQPQRATAPMELRLMDPIDLPR